VVQITISDDDLQDLTSLASRQGLTAEELLSKLIVNAVAADQLAFWGPERMAEIERQIDEIDKHGLPPGTITDHDDESFFRAIRGDVDANV
jgi:hypothetical protein